MERQEALDLGRESFAGKAWRQAGDLLTEADRQVPLEAEDLEQLAAAWYLSGGDEESVEAWSRAHHEYLRRGETARAARCAYWLGFGLLLRNEPARGSGWLARAQRLLDEGNLDCVERGYLLVPQALQLMGQGDIRAANDTFMRAADVGVRFGDLELIVQARLGIGQAMIKLGDVGGGLAMLDEVMVAATAGEVSVITVGIVYCATILECRAVFDLRRAGEWTDALNHWCRSQPDLVRFRNVCQVHRAEIMQMHGRWPDAREEAQRACRRLSGEPAVGAAHLLLGDLHRLRGEFDAAEESYRLSTKWGHDPQPGLALLRLAQGQLDAALASIRRVVEAASDRVTRSRILSAYVEIVLAGGDVAAARVAAGELSSIAAAFDAPFLHASSAYATGAVLLAEGDARAANVVLRRALTTWRDLEAPYEEARTRVLIGRVCRELGDEDAARMELDSARATFAELGALPDLSRLEEVSSTAAPQGASGLTWREVQVLSLVATGKSNREVAADLVISERTVARHVSNIFTKLGLASRSAATAYAYENHLV